MMKWTLAFLITIIGTNCFSQALYRSAESKSGILIGTQNVNSFAGISYENSSDKFSLDYKSLSQNIPAGPLTTFPNFESWNFELALNTEKSKSNLVSKEKWQGGLEFAVTYSFTNDRQTIGKRVSLSHPTKVDEYYVGNGRPGHQYQSLEECSNDPNHTNTICQRGTTNVTNYEPHNKRQNTYYVTLGNEWERFNQFSLSELNPDTTFVSFSNPGRNNFYINAGANFLYQIGPKTYLTWALSITSSFIHNSTRDLTETNIEALSAQYFNSDTMRILSTTKEKSYFLGDGRYETFIVPRFDLFLRYDLGGKKPLIGLVGAIAPHFSSITSNRLNIAIGPSISPSSIPDQVVFAVLNEWTEDKNGDLKYALTFRASVPITFK